MVGCGPVNAAAFRTPGKIFLRREDVDWNVVFDGCFRPRLKDDVAFETTRKGTVQGSEAAGSNHLAQLLAVVVALNKKEIRRLFFSESSISGENQAILCAGGANEAIAGQMLAIDYIVAYDAQPFRQLPEHPIRGEFQIGGGCISS